MEPAVVTLRYPFTCQGVEYSEITMRRPKVRDEKASRRRAGSPAGQEGGRLFANLCEIAPSVIDEMDLADYKQLQDAFTGFFEDEEDRI